MQIVPLVSDQLQDIVNKYQALHAMEKQDLSSKHDTNILQLETKWTNDKVETVKQLQVTFQQEKQEMMKKNEELMRSVEEQNQRSRQELVDRFASEKQKMEEQNVKEKQDMNDRFQSEKQVRKSVES